MFAWKTSADAVMVALHCSRRSLSAFSQYSFGSHATPLIGAWLSEGSYEPSTPSGRFFDLDDLLTLKVGSFA
jgi:hypothetical protein